MIYDLATTIKLLRSYVFQINDRHEYPAEIDLIEFMDESADTSQSYVYCLHAVLGHNGDTDVGSYFAYTKPSRDAQWLHFDDTRVMPVMDSRVFEHSYGGVSILRYKCTRAGQRKTNAFSLIYIRKSMIDDVLLPGSEDEVPLALRESC